MEGHCEHLAVSLGSIMAESGSFLPLLQTLAGAGAAITGIVVTQLWTTQREHAKRRLEVAENMLAQFYEVADAIRFIRSFSVTVHARLGRSEGISVWL